MQGAKPFHKDFRKLKKSSLLRERGKTREKLEILLCYFGHEIDFFYVPQICTKTPPKKCVSKLQNWPEVCLYRPPKAIRVWPKMKKDRGLSKRLLFIKKIFHPKLTHTGSVGKGMKASPSLITPPENPVQGAKPSYKDFLKLRKSSLLREIGKIREKLEILLCRFGHDILFFYVPQICTKTTGKIACQNLKICQGFASPYLQKQFGLGQK